MAAVSDRHLAEDLTGTAFVSAIEALPFRGPIEALGGWLFQIARHDLYDHRRKQARSRIEPLEDNLNEAALADGGVDPEELAIERLEGTRVLAALREALPRPARGAAAPHGRGLTAPEVAAILGKTTGAVKASSTVAWPVWPGYWAYVARRSRRNARIHHRTPVA